MNKPGLLDKQTFSFFKNAAIDIKEKCLLTANVGHFPCDKVSIPSCPPPELSPPPSISTTIITEHGIDDGIPTNIYIFPLVL